jgi:hypothetical protein
MGDQNNNTQKTKDRRNTNPTKSWGCTQVHWKGAQLFNHTTSLTPPLFIEVPVSSQKVSGRVCVS